MPTGIGTAMAVNHGINKGWLDRFTFGHIAVGVVYGLVGVPPLAAAALLIGFEIIEQPLKKHVPAIFPHPSPDSLPNATADVIAGGAGYAVTRAILNGAVTGARVLL